MAKPALELLVEEFISDMVSAYDPGDPVMSHHGREKWEEQVKRAAEDLRDRLEEEVQRCADELRGGYFFND